jgi:hypothetical protein
MIMAKTSHKAKSSGKSYSSKSQPPFMVLVIVMVVLLGLVGYFLSQNNSVGYQTNASNLVQSMGGTLAKKGTPSYAPCKNMSAGYTLIVKQYRFTAKNSVSQTPTPVSTCVVLSVNASLAEPFIGQNVIVTGSPQEGVFFVTAIRKATTPQPTKLPAAK